MRRPHGLAGIPVGLAGIPVGLAGIPIGLAGIPIGLAGIPIGLAGIPVGLDVMLHAVCFSAHKDTINSATLIPHPHHGRMHRLPIH
jgi:hypothetical protein